MSNDFANDAFDGGNSTAVDDVPFDGFDHSFDEFGDMGTEDVDGSKVGNGKPKVDKVGWYHFSINATARPKPWEGDDMSKLRKPDILIECTVLETVAGQSPREFIHYHNLILDGKGPGAAIDQWDKIRMLNFLVGVGILKKDGDQIIDPETGSSVIRRKTLASRLNALGQFVGKLELTKGGDHKDDPSKKYPDRIEFSWGRGVYPVNDPTVAHVPKNREWLAKVQKQASGAKPAESAKAHASPPSTAKAQSNPLADL